MKKERYHFTVVLRPEPEGGFTATVPALPGCVTYGRTLAEARRMAKDAISGYVASLKKRGEAVPTDDETLVTSLDLEYAQTATAPSFPLTTSPSLLWTPTATRCTKR